MILERTIEMKYAGGSAATKSKSHSAGWSESDHCSRQSIGIPRRPDAGHTRLTPCPGSSTGQGTGCDTPPPGLCPQHGGLRTAGDKLGRECLPPGGAALLSSRHGRASGACCSLSKGAPLALVVGRVAGCSVGGRRGGRTPTLLPV